MKAQKQFVVPEIKVYKNKYRLVAEEIHKLLGAGNYANVYNCMTRFRANISNRESVNLDKIKKLPLVKGVQWNGSEIQIIIGGEVVKVVDEFKRYEEDLLKPEVKSKDGQVQQKVKISFGRRILSMITGIMGPSIGILMATGIMSALYAILTLPNAAVLQTSAPNPLWFEGAPEHISEFVGINLTNLYLFDVASAVFFVLKEVILNMIGIFFIYNTVVYFKGNPIFGLAVGITMVSRGFFPVVAGESIPYAEAGFGDWTSSLGKSGFLLFKLGEYPIVVGGYEGVVIPFVVAGVMVTYLDKWIKTWMPSVVDIIFRPTLIYFLTIMGVWFLLGPATGLIEYGLIMGMNAVGNIPYGFGSAFAAFLWQPLVLTGAHVAVIMPMVVSLAQGNVQYIMPAFGFAVWAQTGAVIGVAIITRNMNLKRIAVGGMMGGIFGVTEPIIYGVNLPKVRPFLLGCLGGVVPGFIQGATRMPVVRQGGMGFLSILGFEFSDMPWMALLWVLAVGISAGLVILLYKERKDESTYFMKSIHKLAKFMDGDKSTIAREFESSTSELKGLKNDYKKLDKYYADLSKYESQMITLEDKESKARAKMFKELTKERAKLMKEQDNQLLEKFNTLNTKYSTFSLDDEKTKIQNSIDKVNSTNQELIDKLNKEKTSLYEKTIKIVGKHKLENTQNLIVTNMMWNALNSVEIGYGIEDAKPVKFKKGE